ncbi:MAG: DUF4365 domain-containing protein [Gemmataceae bacterium]|nr:DUF4365 domain-containing protein [Gemmataceae bacterium]
MSGELLPLKTRTRQHVIADLGVNYVQRVFLLAGYTADWIVHDYGFDLKVQTFNERGEVENGTVSVQVKATDRVATHAGGATVPVRVSTRDLKFWLMEWDPVVLALYDAAADRAYWVDVQEYARAEKLDGDTAAGTVTITVATADVLDVDAARRVRDRKNAARSGEKPGR